MGEKQIRRLPVVEDGRLVGMLALGDVAVKTSDEETAGETLEEVSQGVKDGSGQKKQAVSAGSRAARVTESVQEEEDMEEPSAQRGRGGKSRMPQPARGSNQKQGISNRPRGREDARQQKVSPMRAGKSGRPGQRRKAG